MTRIEFRIGRAALKAFGIESIEDLQKKENALIDCLTHKWFRTLKNPKVRGHENTQTIHPLWEAVREKFARYFPGPEGEKLPVKWQPRGSISCDPEALKKQAAGCLASVLAQEFGEHEDEAEAMVNIVRLLNGMRDRIFERTNERAKTLEVLKGVRIRENETPATL